MDDRYSSCCGALVGLAVGDAMGFPAENLTLTQIYESYGPMGLQGFDLLNGGVSITSYVANGLILGLTRGQLKGSMAPFIRYVEMAEREWASTRLYPESGEKKKCWVSSAPTLKTAQCMDNFMLDSLYRGLVATMDEPRNHLKTPGAITAAVPIGLFINPASVPQDQIDLLGAQTVALTHGDPTAFLSGAVLTTACEGIARLISSQLNFFMNKKLVFQSSVPTGKAMLRYYCLAVPQAIAQILLTQGAYMLLGIRDDQSGLRTFLHIVVMCVLFLLSYSIQQRWVFAKQKSN